MTLCADFVNLSKYTNAPPYLLAFYINNIYFLICIDSLYAYLT
ncbi:putative membrane protein [[Clostridium] sordellii ATCC 9714]|nr:putative membrane protein [[Clostridium] sordellii ATCC 9714] [Paeniclostridium sordellii ATCC 9714]